MNNLETHAEAGVIYKPIERYPGYRVGTDGSVWRWRIDKWKRLKLTPNPTNGYLLVNLFSERLGMKRISKTIQVHRIVLETFVGQCPSGMEARHFPDRNRSNNRLDNLMWGTKKQNASDKIAHATDPVGERNPNRKLTEEMVRRIRINAVYKEKSRLSLALELGVTPGAIGHVLSGSTWSHVT